MAPTAVELMTLAVRATAADPGSNTNNANLSTSEAEALARVNRWGPYGYQPALAGGIVFCIGTWQRTRFRTRTWTGPCSQLS